MNRSIPLNGSIDYKPYDAFFRGERGFFGESAREPDKGNTLRKSFTEYLSLPALLTEVAHASTEAFNSWYRNVRSFQYDYESYFDDFWILGSNYDFSTISPKQGMECGEYSCYEKSSREGKICQPGMF